MLHGAGGLPEEAPFLGRLAELSFERRGDYPALLFEDRWHTSGELLRREIGRAYNHAPRNAVEFDQRERRRELLTRCDEYRAAAKRFQRSPERRSSGQFHELD